MRAILNVAAMGLFCVLFLSTLAYFRKAIPVSATAKVNPVDLFLDELKEPELAHQLDGAKHLGDLQDARIVPALSALLAQTKSDEVVEAAVTALSKQRDPRAIPALRSASKQIYDDFLKLTIGKAQLTLGDTEGFATLIEILKDDEAGFARQQASDLVEKTSGRKFGYNAELTVGQNTVALKKIDDWYLKEGSKLHQDTKTGIFK
jgi:HEAT repeat protein